MKKLSLVFIIVFLLSGCVKPYKFVVYEDENIIEEVKSPVHKITSEILTSLKNGKPDVLESYFYKEAEGSEENSEWIQSVYGEYGNRFKDTEFRILTEYYSPSKVNTITIPFILDGYTLSKYIEEHESYLVVYSGKNMSKETAITIFLIKDEGNWMVTDFCIGNFKAMNMRAEDWEEKARIHYENGQILSALMHQQIVMELSQLAPILTHDNFEQYQRTYDKYQKEIYDQYEMPLVVQYDDQHEVQVFSIQPGFAGNEFIYIVGYVTEMGSIDGNDELIESESRNLHSEILNVFPDIEVGINNIVYKAYEELPVEQKLYKTYGTVVELGESK